MAERLIVAGSGFAGLVAPLAAHEAGLETVVYEKGARLGGATAVSGGHVWVAANQLVDADDLLRGRLQRPRQAPRFTTPVPSLPRA